MVAVFFPAFWKDNYIVFCLSLIWLKISPHSYSSFEVKPKIVFWLLLFFWCVLHFTMICLNVLFFKPAWCMLTFKIMSQNILLVLENSLQLCLQMFSHGIFLLFSSYNSSCTYNTPFITPHYFLCFYLFFWYYFALPCFKLNIIHIYIHIYFLNDSVSFLRLISVTDFSVLKFPLLIFNS